MATSADEDHQTQDLSRRASQGDSQCIESLLVRYLPRLSAFVRSQVGERLLRLESTADLVQSTCRELIIAGPDFQWQGEARFRGWLFTTALNKIRMRLRHHGAQKRSMPLTRESNFDALADPRAAANTPSAIAAGHELTSTMETAMAALPPDYREVIALCRLAELPHAEVARIMDRSPGAVRVLLSRALCALVEAVDRIEGRHS